MIDIEVAGETVQLLAHRALFLRRFSTLVVADLHWGKSATFRAKGIPLPPGVTTSDLDRLSSALSESSATRLVIVGDLLHARAGRHARTLHAISEWRAQHAQLEMILVRGNHDSHAGDPPASLNIECIDGPLIVGPFACQHHPTAHANHYVLAGHLHPRVSMRGRGRQSVRLPCFAFCDGGAVLPAFTTFTGGGAYTPTSDDRIYAIVDDEVVPVSVAQAPTNRRSG